MTLLHHYRLVPYLHKASLGEYVRCPLDAGDDGGAGTEGRAAAPRPWKRKKSSWYSQEEGFWKHRGRRNWRDERKMSSRCRWNEGDCRTAPATPDLLNTSQMMQIMKKSLQCSQEETFVMQPGKRHCNAAKKMSLQCSQEDVITIQPGKCHYQAASIKDVITIDQWIGHCNVARKMSLRCSREEVIVMRSGRCHYNEVRKMSLEADVIVAL